MVSVQQINNYLNRLPARISSAPLDEKVAYFSVILGILLIIVWIMIKVIF